MAEHEEEDEFNIQQALVNFAHAAAPMVELHLAWGDAPPEEQDFLTVRPTVDPDLPKHGFRFPPRTDFPLHHVPNDLQVRLLKPPTFNRT
eukprot:3229861-Pyramimonas_sp.AAC.1